MCGHQEQPHLRSTVVPKHQIKVQLHEATFTKQYPNGIRTRKKTKGNCNRKTHQTGH